MHGLGQASVQSASRSTSAAACHLAATHARCGRQLVCKAAPTPAKCSTDGPGFSGRASEAPMYAVVGQAASHSCKVALATLLSSATLLTTAMPSAPWSARMAAHAVTGATDKQHLQPDPDAMQSISTQIKNHPAPELAQAKSSAQPASATPTPASSKRTAKIQAKDLAELLGISQGQAKEILSSKDTRDLSRTQLGQVEDTVDAFASALGLERRQASKVLVKQPRVLLVPAPTLLQRLRELASMLVAPPKLAAKLVAKQPGLLVHAPETLRARLSGLCAVFNVDPALAQEVAKFEPGLLAVNSKELEARASTFISALDLTRPQGVAVLRRHPGALLQSEQALRDRVKRIAAVVSVPESAVGTLVLNAPRLAAASLESLERNLAGVQQLLQVDKERAQVLCAEQPALLVTQPAVLQERLKVLSELVGMPPKQARVIAASRPALLTKSTEAMRRSVAAAAEDNDTKGGSDAGRR